MDPTHGPDPNEGSTDPMVPAYWQAGEDLQDRIRAAGFESETVDGIAVDVHDLLQACDRIRDEILPDALNGSDSDLDEHLERLRNELRHIEWHVQAAESYLRKANSILKPQNEQPI